MDPQPAPPTPSATESLDLSTTLVEEALPEEEVEPRPPQAEGLGDRVEPSGEPPVVHDRPDTAVKTAARDTGPLDDRIKSTGRTVADVYVY